MIENEFQYTDYPALLAYIQSLADEPYRKMQNRIVPGAENIMGVRVPKLRNLAKQLAKGDWRAYLLEAQDTSYEETMLQGLVIGYAKTEQEETLRRIADFIPKINNWAVCDVCCSSFQTAAKDKEKLLEFLLPYLKSSQEFELRFAAVMMMDFLITDAYIDTLLRMYDGIHHDGYYVKMAVAWALSVCFVKYPDKTMRYLHANHLDDWTYNKTLQKIVESYRVEAETKTVIRGMRRGK
jgi:3-methyladenine DNA glycosylase AlkD